MYITEVVTWMVNLMNMYNNPWLSQYGIASSGETYICLWHVRSGCYISSELGLGLNFQ